MTVLCVCLFTPESPGRGKLTCASASYFRGYAYVKWRLTSSCRHQRSPSSASVAECSRASWLASVAHRLWSTTPSELFREHLISHAYLSWYSQFRIQRGYARQIPLPHLRCARWGNISSACLSFAPILTPLHRRLHAQPRQRPASDDLDA